jgi:alpha-glucosidase
VSTWTPGEREAKAPHPDDAQLPWWTSAVFYQIYPRSFLDTDGDGVGDLEGVRQKLPYLARLGVDALWLSPFYPSPMHDFGYDVADYCDVDPLFGSLEDARRLVIEAHEHGLRVIVDFVPNHTSSEHPWFVDARSSRTAAHRDWYVWRDPAPVAGGTLPGPPPNGWAATFTPDEPAWTWDAETEQWYLHVFLPEQPDLDWTNPAVVDAMHGVLRFWLDLGVDGFRIDVVHYIGKDIPLGPDVPPPEATELTHELLRGLRELLDAYPRQPMMVGEVFIFSTRQVATFYGRGDELHLSFNFPPLYAPWEAAAWRKRIDRVIEELDPVGAWPTWVLSNHDNPRHRTRYGTPARARAAVLLLLGTRGTPFLYAGEELGLSDAVIPPDRVVDPGGRDGCRAPIPWEGGAAHGWQTADPWLPWPPEAAAGGDAAAQEPDPGSSLHLYRAALAARHRHPALGRGSFRWLESPPDVLAWERETDGDRVAVVVNFADAPAAGVLPDGWKVEVSSTAGAPGQAWTGQLPGSASAWLVPESL